MKFPRGENYGDMTAWMRDPFVTVDNHVIELAPDPFSPQTEISN